MPEASRVDSGTGFQTTLPIATCGQRGTAKSAVDGGGGVSRRAGSARRPPRSARPVREQRGGAERRQVAGTPFCRPRAGTVGFYPGGASAGGGVQEGGKAPVRSANRGAGRHSGQRGRLPAPWTRREKRTVSSVARDQCPSRSPAPAARGAAVRAPVPDGRRASWFPRRERQTPSTCSVFILLHVRQGRVPVPKTGGRGTLAVRPHTHRALNGSSVSRGTGGGSVPTDRQFTVLGN